MIIDTHAHLYLEQFDKDIDEVINRAKHKGISNICLPNIDSSTFSRMMLLSDRSEGFCLPMIGLHPCSVKEDFRDELDFISSSIELHRFYGIGETGIDLYWDQSFKKQQIESFEWQIDLAKKRKLPIIIHSRDSLDLTIDIISDHQDDDLTGIFHCFNGSIEQCRRIMDNNFLMGLGGVVTFKNAKLDEVVRYMPNDGMVLETDAPYLSPTPFRGKRNESSYITHVAEKVAEFRKLESSQICEITTVNAKRLFGI